MTLDKTTLTAEMLDAAIEELDTRTVNNGVDTEAVGLAVRTSVKANALLIKEYAQALIGEESIETAFKFSFGAGLLIGWRLCEAAKEVEGLEKLFDKSLN